MPEVRRRTIDNILGQNITSAITGSIAGATMGQMLMRTSMAGQGGPPVSVTIDSTVIGQSYSAPGTNDVSLDLPEGYYVVSAMYQVGFDAEPSSGYAKLELTKNAVVIGGATVSAANGLGAAWPPASDSTWFVGGGLPVRALGTVFADAAIVSEALTLTALRVA